MDSKKMVKLVTDITKEVKKNEEQNQKQIILANKKIIAQGTPKDLINNEEAKSFYFGDTFNIN